MAKKKLADKNTSAEVVMTATPISYVRSAYSAVDIVFLSDPRDEMIRRYLVQHGRMQTITVNRSHVETFTNCRCVICTDALALLGLEYADGVSFGG